MSELKPCPFCPDGGDVRMLSYFCEVEYTAYAHCRKCGAYGPRISESLPLEEVKAEAAEAWNRRAYRSCCPKPCNEQCWCAGERTYYAADLRRAMSDMMERYERRDGRANDADN